MTIGDSIPVRVERVELTPQELEGEDTDAALALQVPIRTQSGIIIADRIPDDLQPPTR